MKPISKKFYKWITKQNQNLPVIGLITFSFPHQFVRSIYEENTGKGYWGDKKACVTLSFDCDYPEDADALPAVSESMSSLGLKGSFAVVGHWVEKYPDQHKAIVECGHEVINHTYSHPDNEILNPGRKFREISRDEKIEEIVRCHDICENVLGCKLEGLRIPHFKNLFTDDIYSILKELGYSFSSSTWLTNTTSHGLPFWADHDILEFPLATCPSHPFTVFDSWHSLNSPRLSHRIKHRGAKAYFDLFKELIMFGKETGSYINLYLDPLDIKKIPQFNQILELLTDDELLVLTYEDYIKNNCVVL